jgi:hypothetical protein
MLGWRKHLVRPPAVVTIDAEHAAMLSPEFAPDIVRAIVDQLSVP